LQTSLTQKMNRNRQKIDGGWRLLDHTADIMIEVWGASLESVFLNSAEAMTAVLVPCTDLPTETEFEVALEADTLEELLVNWLREILFHSQVRNLILVQARIEDLSRIVLRAKLYFGAVRPDCEPEFEIKGVTYHGLSIQQHDETYSARIVFDI
jgi:SHS2 domain-containing protein